METTTVPLLTPKEDPGMEIRTIKLASHSHPFSTANSSRRFATHTIPGFYSESNFYRHTLMEREEKGVPFGILIVYALH